VQKAWETSNGDCREEDAQGWDLQLRGMYGLRFRGKRQRETKAGKKAERTAEELREGAELLMDAKP
jgi:hypothetical protein